MTTSDSTVERGSGISYTTDEAPFVMGLISNTAQNV